MQVGTWKLHFRGGPRCKQHYSLVGSIHTVIQLVLGGLPVWASDCWRSFNLLCCLRVNFSQHVYEAFVHRLPYNCTAAALCSVRAAVRSVSMQMPQHEGHNLPQVMRILLIENDNDSATHMSEQRALSPAEQRQQRLTPIADQHWMQFPLKSTPA